MNAIYFGLIVLVFTVSCNNEKKRDTTSLAEQYDIIEEPSDYGGQLFTIESNDYRRFILAENTTSEYIFSATSEYCALSGGTNYNEHYFGFSTFEGWEIILIPRSIDFYTYHNLIGWMWGYGQDAPIPTHVYGVALHESDSLLNYYVELDKSSMFGDELVGGFQNGDCHHINMPEAFDEGGNIKISSKVSCSYSEIKELFIQLDYDLKRLPTRDYSLKQIKLYE